MALTSAQLTTLKAAILADPVLAAFPDDSDGAFAIAAALNLAATPTFWVWRTRLSKADITDVESVDATNWSWTAYIARSAGEQAGFREMFAVDGTVNASKPNVRQGFADVFSGGQGSAQRTHLLAVARRPATRAEKLFATGTGDTGSPATMTVVGALSYQDVMQARRS